jgi:lipopolysaccharide/colanic/teichoic acid biosynthesis glycosyltransferase
LGQQIIKRLFDVIVSVLILFFMLPVILIISVVIKLDSHGPIIYSSKRIGQFGVPFDRYIFRTIYADNKITYIGKFLRKTSFDELPALYNVLVGEMSLIGPRPRLPIHLINGLDFEKQILLVKPGITGLSQIRIASILSYQEIIFLDLDYVKKWSLLLDAKIFFKTIQVVLLGYRK